MVHEILEQLDQQVLEENLLLELTELLKVQEQRELLDLLQVQEVILQVALLEVHLAQVRQVQEVHLAQEVQVQEVEDN